MWGMKMIIKYMSKLICILAILFLSCGETAPLGGSLSISTNNRYLLKDGKPFFYLADTAWDIFIMLDRDEADKYLEDRAAKGFNVILTTLIGWKPYKEDTNAYGEEPLINKDPTKPNELYFQHVDYIVDKANSLGIIVAVAPAWSEWMYDNVVKNGPHPFNVNNARTYGEYVGNRFKDKEIIWIIGGDRNPEGYQDILTAMAEGLDKGDKSSDFLTTFHGVKKGEFIPPENIFTERLGYSYFFHNENWLDFNSVYSGHGWAYPIYRLIAIDRKLKPVKPTIEIEPNYENHPLIGDGSGYYSDKKRWDGKTRTTASLVREQAYWALLAGAAGHTYGCHDIWQFYDEGIEPNDHANTYWQEAINFPGAVQMGILRRLFESRQWYTMVPDQQIISAGQGSGENHKQAARASDGKFLFVYLPRGNGVTVNMEKISGKNVKAYWFNPRNGSAIYINQFPCSGTRQFTAPSSGVDNDWVLVLDDAEQDYPHPGTK